jgi:hypothetical protein
VRVKVTRTYWYRLPVSLTHPGTRAELPNTSSRSLDGGAPAQQQLENEERAFLQKQVGWRKTKGGQTSALMHAPSIGLQCLCQSAACLRMEEVV